MINTTQGHYSKSPNLLKQDKCSLHAHFPVSHLSIFNGIQTALSVLWGPTTTTTTTTTTKLIREYTNHMSATQQNIYIVINRVFN